MPAIRQVTPNQIEDILREIRGAKAVTITAKTELKMKVSARQAFSGPVFKLSRVNGMINWVYENAVNRQREREGVTADFESHPRQWGVRLQGTPFVQHNDSLYLELKVEKSLEEPTYVDVEGNAVTFDAVQPHLTARSNSSRQGVEKQIILRDYRMDSITSITVNGTCYIIVR